jgi:hypothetical protein
MAQSENTKLNKISVFDLDETITRMPSYTASKRSEREAGVSFPTPYSFYDHPVSMDRNLHNIQFISPVIDDWREASLDSSCRTILITHRVKELASSVDAVLWPAGLGFDAKYLLGRKTEKFDTLIKELEENPSIKTVRIYEDTLEQIIKYRTGFDSLSKEYDVQFYFVDKAKVFRLLDFEVGEKRRIELI